MGKAAVIPVDFNEPQKRTPDDRVKSQYDPNNPNGGRGGFGGAGRGRGEQDPNRMEAREMARQIDQMLHGRRRGGARE